jgi:hypothetical protein
LLENEILGAAALVGQSNIYSNAPVRVKKSLVAGDANEGR